MNRLVPNLTGVSETMLLALHNRAVEAKRRDAVLIDPDSVRIYEAIDCDFRHRFGNSEGSLAARVAEIDRVLRQWLECHPEGLVVSLGEGLETQVRRVDNGRMRWLSGRLTRSDSAAGMARSVDRSFPPPCFQCA
jgi:O-methyltransferase involved in polyketide biosynthesis